MIIENMISQKQKFIEILENFWPRNKAKGLLAQTVFVQEIRNGNFGKNAPGKILPGCWLLAPKSTDFYKFRFCFFIHPYILKKADVNIFGMDKLLGEYYRPFHAIADFMENAGIGIIYVAPFSNDGGIPLDDIKKRNFESLKWAFFIFKGDKFIKTDPFKFFNKWEGNRGRPSYGGDWDPDIRKKISQLDIKILTSLLINELFYTGFVKGTLKKPLNDPYDIDAFLVSFSQSVILPIEIKEKFPGTSGNNLFFGIDAGRIMMLLRICIPNDANAIYLIRELDEDGNFIKWKYVTLSDIIMASSWNLQAGGKGMGGQNTQTIRLPYNLFRELTDRDISEENLKQIGNLPKDAKNIAIYFNDSILKRFNNYE